MVATNLYRALMMANEFKYSDIQVLIELLSRNINLSDIPGVDASCSSAPLVPPAPSAPPAPEEKLSPPEEVQGALSALISRAVKGLEEEALSDPSFPALPPRTALPPYCNEQPRFDPYTIRMRTSIDLTRQQIVEIFSPFGEILDCSTVTSETRMGTMAAMKFEKPSKASSAVRSLHGKSLMGGVMYVQHAFLPECNLETGVVREVTDLERDWPLGSRLLVRGPVGLTDNFLHQIFMWFGKIEHIALLSGPSDRTWDTGFVKYSSAAEAAVAKHSVKTLSAILRRNGFLKPGERITAQPAQPSWERRRHVPRASN